MAVEIWLTFDAEGSKVHFPVNPSKLQVSRGSKTQTVDIVELGEVSIINGSAENTISWSSHFPAHYYPGCSTTNLPDPLATCQMIDGWRTKPYPCHLIITGQSAPVSMYCTIESFPYYEQGGDIGSQWYSITLKEYREVSVGKVVVANKKATVSKSTPRVDNKVQPKTYTVKSGDCLINIARKCGVSDWHDLYNANKSVVGSNPNLIYPNQKLTIPQKSA